MFWVVEDGRGEMRISSRIGRYGIKLCGFAHFLRIGAREERPSGSLIER
jgi:hypothetical protein